MDPAGRLAPATTNDPSSVRRHGSGGAAWSSVPSGLESQSQQPPRASLYPSRQLSVSIGTGSTTPHPLVSSSSMSLSPTNATSSPALVSGESHSPTSSSWSQWQAQTGHVTTNRATTVSPTPASGSVSDQGTTVASARSLQPSSYAVNSAGMSTKDQVGGHTGHITNTQHPTSSAHQPQQNLYHHQSQGAHQQNQQRLSAALPSRTGLYRRAASATTSFHPVTFSTSASSSSSSSTYPSSSSSDQHTSHTDQQTQQLHQQPPQTPLYPTTQQRRLSPTLHPSSRSNVISPPIQSTSPPQYTNPSPQTGLYNGTPTSAANIHQSSIMPRPRVSTASHNTLTTGSPAHNISNTTSYTTGPQPLQNPPGTTMNPSTAPVNTNTISHDSSSSGSYIGGNGSSNPVLTTAVTVTAQQEALIRSKREQAQLRQQLSELRKRLAGFQQAHAFAEQAKQHVQGRLEQKEEEIRKATLKYNTEQQNSERERQRLQQMVETLKQTAEAERQAREAKERELLQLTLEKTLLETMGGEDELGELSGLGLGSHRSRRSTGSSNVSTNASSVYPSNRAETHEGNERGSVSRDDTDVSLLDVAFASVDALDRTFEGDALQVDKSKATNGQLSTEKAVESIEGVHDDNEVYNVGKKRRRSGNGESDEVQGIQDEKVVEVLTESGRKAVDESETRGTNKASKRFKPTEVESVTTSSESVERSPLPQSSHQRNQDQVRGYRKDQGETEVEQLPQVTPLLSRTMARMKKSSEAASSISSTKSITPSSTSMQSATPSRPSLSQPPSPMKHSKSSSSPATTSVSADTMLSLKSASNLLHQLLIQSVKKLTTDIHLLDAQLQLLALLSTEASSNGTVGDCTFNDDYGSESGHLVGSDVPASEIDSRPIKQFVAMIDKIMSGFAAPYSSSTLSEASIDAESGASAIGNSRVASGSPSTMTAFDICISSGGGITGPCHSSYRANPLAFLSYLSLFESYGTDIHRAASSLYQLTNLLTNVPTPSSLHQIPPPTSSSSPSNLVQYMDTAIQPNPYLSSSFRPDQANRTHLQLFIRSLLSVCLPALLPISASTTSTSSLAVSPPPYPSGPPSGTAASLLLPLLSTIGNSPSHFQFSKLSGDYDRDYSNNTSEDYTITASNASDSDYEPVKKTAPHLEYFLSPPLVTSSATSSDSCSIIYPAASLSTLSEDLNSTISFIASTSPSLLGELLRTFVERTSDRHSSTSTAMSNPILGSAFKSKSTIPSFSTLSMPLTSLQSHYPQHYTTLTPLDLATNPCEPCIRRESTVATSRAILPTLTSPLLSRDATAGDSPPSIPLSILLRVGSSLFPSPLVSPPSSDDTSYSTQVLPFLESIPRSPSLSHLIAVHPALPIRASILLPGPLLLASWLAFCTPQLTSLPPTYSGSHSNFPQILPSSTPAHFSSLLLSSSFALPVFSCITLLTSLPSTLASSVLSLAHQTRRLSSTASSQVHSSTTSDLSSTSLPSSALPTYSLSTHFHQNPSYIHLEPCLSLFSLLRLHSVELMSFPPPPPATTLILPTLPPSTPFSRFTSRSMSSSTSTRVFDGPETSHPPSPPTPHSLNKANDSNFRQSTSIYTSTLSSISGLIPPTVSVTNSIMLPLPEVAQPMMHAPPAICDEGSTVSSTSCNMADHTAATNIVPPVTTTADPSSIMTTTSRNTNSLITPARPSKAAFTHTAKTSGSIPTSVPPFISNDHQLTDNRSVSSQSNSSSYFMPNYSGWIHITDEARIIAYLAHQDVLTTSKRPSFPTLLPHIYSSSAHLSSQPSRPHSLSSQPMNTKSTLAVSPQMPSLSSLYVPLQQQPFPTPFSPTVATTAQSLPLQSPSRTSSSHRVDLSSSPSIHRNTALSVGAVVSTHEDLVASLKSSSPAVQLNTPDPLHSSIASNTHSFTTLPDIPLPFSSPLPSITLSWLPHAEVSLFDVVSTSQSSNQSPAQSCLLPIIASMSRLYHSVARLASVADSSFQLLSSGNVPTSFAFVSPQSVNTAPASTSSPLWAAISDSGCLGVPAYIASFVSDSPSTLPVANLTLNSSISFSLIATRLRSTHHSARLSTYMADNQTGPGRTTGSSSGSHAPCHTSNLSSFSFVAPSTSSSTKRRRSTGTASAYDAITASTPSVAIYSATDVIHRSINVTLPPHAHILIRRIFEFALPHIIKETGMLDATRVRALAHNDSLLLSSSLVSLLLTMRLTLKSQSTLFSLLLMSLPANALIHNPISRDRCSERRLYPWTSNGKEENAEIATSEHDCVCCVCVCCGCGKRLVKNKTSHMNCHRPSQGAKHQEYHDGHAQIFRDGNENNTDQQQEQQQNQHLQQTEQQQPQQKEISLPSLLASSESVRRINAMKNVKIKIGGYHPIPVENTTHSTSSAATTHTTTTTIEEVGDASRKSDHNISSGMKGNDVSVGSHLSPHRCETHPSHLYSPSLPPSLFRVVVGSPCGPVLAPLQQSLCLLSVMHDTEAIASPFLSFIDTLTTALSPSLPLTPTYTTSSNPIGSLLSRLLLVLTGPFARALLPLSGAELLPRSASRHHIPTPTILTSQPHVSRNIPFSTQPHPTSSNPPSTRQSSAPPTEPTAPTLDPISSSHLNDCNATNGSTYQHSPALSSSVTCPSAVSWAGHSAPILAYFLTHPSYLRGSHCAILATGIIKTLSKDPIHIRALATPFPTSLLPNVHCPPSLHHQSPPHHTRRHTLSGSLHNLYAQPMSSSSQLLNSSVSPKISPSTLLRQPDGTPLLPSPCDCSQDRSKPNLTSSLTLPLLPLSPHYLTHKAGPPPSTLLSHPVFPYPSNDTSLLWVLISCLDSTRRSIYRLPPPIDQTSIVSSVYLATTQTVDVLLSSPSSFTSSSASASSISSSSLAPLPTSNLSSQTSTSMRHLPRLPDPTTQHIPPTDPQPPLPSTQSHTSFSSTTVSLVSSICAFPTQAYLSSHQLSLGNPPFLSLLDGPTNPRPSSPSSVPSLSPAPTLSACPSDPVVSLHIRLSSLSVLLHIVASYGVGGLAALLAGFAPDHQVATSYLSSAPTFRHTTSTSTRVDDVQEAMSDNTTRNSTPATSSGIPTSSQAGQTNMVDQDQNQGFSTSPWSSSLLPKSLSLSSLLAPYVTGLSWLCNILLSAIHVEVDILAHRPVLSHHELADALWKDTTQMSASSTQSVDKAVLGRETKRSVTSGMKNNNPMSTASRRSKSSSPQLSFSTNPTSSPQDRKIAGTSDTRSPPSSLPTSISVPWAPGTSAVSDPSACPSASADETSRLRALFIAKALYLLTTIINHDPLTSPVVQRLVGLRQKYCEICSQYCQQRGLNVDNVGESMDKRDSVSDQHTQHQPSPTSTSPTNPLSTSSPSISLHSFLPTLPTGNVRWFQLGRSAQPTLLHITARVLDKATHPLLVPLADAAHALRDATSVTCSTLDSLKL